MICSHGQLKRQCPLCLLEDEASKLESELEKLRKDNENLKMLNIWASKLVGNKAAFEYACEKWQESFEMLVNGKGK